eukprot:scaffold3942_cov123-Isochrysis_galbana.AAC.8
MRAAQCADGRMHALPQDAQPTPHDAESLPSPRPSMHLSTRLRMPPVARVYRPRPRARGIRSDVAQHSSTDAQPSQSPCAGLCRHASTKHRAGASLRLTLHEPKPPRQSQAFPGSCRTIAPSRWYLLRMA